MAKISRLHRIDLSSRRTLSLDLPEFLVQALECRVAEANEGATVEEQVTLEHMIEVEIAGCLSLAEVAYLEQTLPGIGAAVSRWLNDIE